MLRTAASYMYSILFIHSTHIITTKVSTEAASRICRRNRTTGQSEKTIMVVNSIVEGAECA